MTVTLQCRRCQGLVVQLIGEDKPRVCPSCRLAPDWEVHTCRTR